MKSLRAIVCGAGFTCLLQEQTLPTQSCASYIQYLAPVYKGSTDDFYCKVTHFFKTMFSVASRKASGILIIPA